MGAATATQQLNKPYFAAPMSLFNYCGRRLPLGTIVVSALFASFSGKVQDDGTLSTCTRSKKQLHEEVCVSLSTVYRALNELDDKGKLTLLENKENTYILEHDSDGFLRIDKRLLTEDWDIYDEKTKKVIERRKLTLAEVVVAALIITRCYNKKHDKHIYEASYPDIAKELDLAESTVERVIPVLKAAKIIVRKSQDVGVNRYKKSTYSANRKFKWIYKKSAQPKEPPQPEQVQHSDTSNSPQAGLPKNDYYKYLKECEERSRQIAEREQKYYDAKFAAEEAAEKNYLRAMQDEQFKKATEELMAVSIEIGKAEGKAADGKAPDELYKRESELHERRREALKRLGMNESSITVPDEYQGDARGSPPSGGM